MTTRNIFKYLSLMPVLRLNLIYCIKSCTNTYYQDPSCGLSFTCSQNKCKHRQHLPAKIFATASAGVVALLSKGATRMLIVTLACICETDDKTKITFNLFYPIYQYGMDYRLLSIWDTTENHNPQEQTHSQLVLQTFLDNHTIINNISLKQWDTLALSYS